jgi:ferritin-like metal-binding protein YciE
MKIDSLNKLYIEQLKDIYSAENQLVAALPKMAKAASAPELQQAFEEHLLQTKGHVHRIEEIFSTLDYSPSGHKCKAMEGLIEEGADLIKEEDIEPDVLDAGLIAAAQRVEHYEIAAYGTVRTYAEQLGYEDAADLLQQTLDEEYDTDDKLSELAVNTINPEAMAA